MAVDAILWRGFAKLRPAFTQDKSQFVFGGMAEARLGYRGTIKVYFIAGLAGALTVDVAVKGVVQVSAQLRVPLKP